jgi:4-amino-4-deoxy-L-arabinose transferase-like glycosyltransferase
MLGDERVAIVAAVLTIVWPPYIAYSSMLYSETVALPFFLLFLILLPRGSRVAYEDRPLALAIGSGIALAWCMLLRPMYLLFVPFVIVIMLLEERRYALAAQRIALVLVGCFVVLAPWALYSTRSAGMPILISANGGETLAGGLNPALIAQGFRRGVEGDGRSVWTGPGKWILPQQTGYLSPQELALSYTQRDALLRKRSVLWIEQHPLSALSLEKAKLLYMWGFYPLGFNVKETLLGDVPVLIFLALALVAVVGRRTHAIELSRFIVLPFLVSLVALISWGSWRFRQPGDIGLLVLGAIVIASFTQRSGRTSALTPPIAAPVS